MNLILPIFVSLVIFIITIIILKRSKKLQKIINNNKSEIESLYIIASIFTILSVVLGLIQFNAQQERIKKIELENQKILLESFNDEINYNLEIVNGIENLTAKLLETEEWPYFHYSTISLEQIVADGKIGDISLRQQLRRVYSLTDQANRVLSSTTIFIPLTSEQYDSFMKLKKERANSLLNYNSEIKGELLDLQPKIITLSQSI